MNEFIKKLIERLEEKKISVKSFSDVVHNNAVKICISEVNQLAEEYSQDLVEDSPRLVQDWIPCEKELPKEYTALCCNKFGEMIIGHPFFDESSGTNYSAESEHEYMYECIAWQPLPEPYQPKGE